MGADAAAVVDIKDEGALEQARERVGGVEVLDFDVPGLIVAKEIDGPERARIGAVGQLWAGDKAAFWRATRRRRSPAHRAV